MDPERREHLRETLRTAGIDEAALSDAQLEAVFYRLVEQTFGEASEPASAPGAEDAASAGGLPVNPAIAQLNPEAREAFERLVARVQQTVTAALEAIDFGDAPAVGLFTPPSPLEAPDLGSVEGHTMDLNPPLPVVRELVHLPARRLRAEVWSNGDPVWSTLTSEDWLRTTVPDAEKLDRSLQSDVATLEVAAGGMDDERWMTPAFVLAEEVARRLNAAGQSPPVFAADDMVDMDLFWEAFDRVIEPATRARWHRQDLLEEHR